MLNEINIKNILINIELLKSESLEENGYNFKK